MIPVEIPTLNLVAVIPHIVVVITALLVMMFDMIVEDKRLTGHVTLLGLGVALVTTLLLFGAEKPPSFQELAVSDGYALVLNLVFLTTAILSVLVAFSYLPDREMEQGEYYALLLFATAGMMLMGAATDLIIVFLGLEIMSIALYIMAAFNRRQISSGEAGMKYFVLGAFASAFFLYGAALLYGATGSTNLKMIGAFITQVNSDLAQPMMLVGLGLLLIGFGFKVSAVPFQWWTPDVYHGAPTSVTAFMSVGAKAAGFAALMRVLMVSFETFRLDWQIAVAVLAALTMIGGNVAALAQQDVKRMLAYSSIAHAGYALVGVTAGTRTGIDGVLFYLMAYAFMNIGAFAVIAVLERRNAVGTKLAEYAGLAARRPLLALAMAIFMFSLTGIPPTVGFWGKFYLFRAAVISGFSWLAVIGVINSAISAFYYVGVVVQMYMRSPEADAPDLFPGGPVRIALAITGLVTLFLGFWPTPLVSLTSLGIFG